MKKIRISIVVVLFLAAAWLLAGWIVVGLEPAKMGVLDGQRGGFALRRVSIDLRQAPHCLSQADSCLAWMATHPQSQMWLRLHHLPDSLLPWLNGSIDSLCQRHQVEPHRLMLESEEWTLLHYLALRNRFTLHTLNSPHPSELTRRGIDSVVTRAERLATSGCLSALVIGPEWYPYMRHQYAHTPTHLVVTDTVYSPWSFCLRPMHMLMLADTTVHAVVLGKE